MSESKQSEGICFNNMRINSITLGSGIFTGDNIQYLWYSQCRQQSGFGTITGEENSLENPCCVVTDPESSSQVLEYFRKLTEQKIGRCEL